MIAMYDDRKAALGSGEFFQKTLDSLLAHIAILDSGGTIIAVNAAWDGFARGNGAGDAGFGVGANYLRACDRATGDCSEEAGVVAQGIREVIVGSRSDFDLEYPCHSPAERRWFCVRVTRFEIDGEVRVVVTHDNITLRKLAEIQVRESNRLLLVQASTDGLTGLANRRSFDETLGREWKAHRRDRSALSLALLDVDCFKQFNDHQGHPAGDECLKAVARSIQTALRRPCDFAARYGGEEFAVILPRTDERGAAEILQATLRGIRELSIPHPTSKVVRGVVTLSIGAATMFPGEDRSLADLLKRADEALYEAKSGGRDQLVCSGRAGSTQSSPRHLLGPITRGEGLLQALRDVADPTQDMDRQSQAGGMATPQATTRPSNTAT